MRVICIKADGLYYPGVPRLDIGEVYEVEHELPGEAIFLGAPGVLYYYISSLRSYYASFCFVPWSDEDEANVETIFNAGTRKQQIEAFYKEVDKMTKHLF